MQILMFPSAKPGASLLAFSLKTSYAFSISLTFVSKEAKSTVIIVLSSFSTLPSPRFLKNPPRNLWYNIVAKQNPK